ncbi:MAG: hypothetical protein AB1542_07285, partial [Pseudomonadota bacterium]
MTARIITTMAIVQDSYRVVTIINATRGSRPEPSRRRNPDARVMAFMAKAGRLLICVSARSAWLLAVSAPAWPRPALPPASARA